MPQLWADTRQAHHDAVDNAILAAATELVAEQHTVAISMSAVAERAGIGRPTLYKHYRDVESILAEHHKREVAEQFELLQEQLATGEVSLGHLAEIIKAQRHANRARSATHLVIAFAHTTGDNDPADARIHDALTTLLAQLADDGLIRTDRTPRDLARWILHTVHAPETLDDDDVATLVVDSLRTSP
jgi:AcrR family transcriptional regulator